MTKEKSIRKSFLRDKCPYPESGESGSWPLVKVSHVEVIVALDDLAVFLPVEGGGWEAVHPTLEDDLVARSLLDPGPGDTDL